MTWIVGGAGVWWPFLVGDIRVSWEAREGRRELDCLRKIHPVAPNIIGSFAGSVTLGFRVLDSIALQLHLRGTRPPLPAIARQWLPRLMLRAFSVATPAERELGCQYLFIGAHPTVQRIPGLPQVCAVKFSAPRFEPVFAKYNACIGIGSGNQYEVLRTAADETYASFASSRMNSRLPGLLGHMMAWRLRDLLLANPTRGISEWFYFASVDGGGIVLQPYSCTEAGPEGRAEVEPPTVAASASEFATLVRSHGLSAEAASA